MDEKLRIPVVVIDRLTEIWLDRWRHGPFCPREVTQKTIDERRPLERISVRHDLFCALRLITEAGGHVVWEPVPPASAKVEDGKEEAK